MKWESYYKWYYQPAIKFCLLPWVKNREFALLTPPEMGHTERSTRYLKIGNVQSFDFLYKVTGMIDHHSYYNFYSSVARYYSGLPNVPYRREERESFKPHWINNHWKEINGYDLFIDIDGSFEDWAETINSTKLVINFLDQHEIPYYLKYSGKGFHFICPYSALRLTIPEYYRSFNPADEHNIYALFGMIARWMYNNVTELVDTGIYDSRRISKLPYTWAIYNHEEAYLCHLLSDSQKEKISTFDYREFHFDINHHKFLDWKNHKPTLFNSSRLQDPKNQKIINWILSIIEGR